MKIGIGMIVYTTVPEHLYFLRQTIESINTAYDYKLYLLLNRTTRQSMEYVNKLELNKNNLVVLPVENEVSVAEGWNIIINHAFLDDCEYVVVPNTDIVFHPNCINNLVSFAEKNKEHDGKEVVLWTAAEHNDLRTLKMIEEREDYDAHPHFSCFMVNQRTAETAGLFDSGFTRGYMEDVSWHWKCKFLGYEALKTASAWFYHFGSRTIECDNNLKKSNIVTHGKNREYFVEKHGFDGFEGIYNKDGSLREGYEHPFNDEGVAWRNY